MTLKELYEHYERFAPTALDAELVIQVEEWDSERGTRHATFRLDEHLLSTFSNQLVLTPNYEEEV